MTTNQAVALMVFVGTYLGLVLFTRKKLPIVAAASVIVLLWPGVMDLSAALRSVNWNVIMLYFGMLLLTEAFIMSKAPAALTERFVREGHSARWAVLGVCAFCGLISTVMENVAAVLIAAPLALAMTKRLGVSPVPVLIGMSVMSNLQGAATQIGDPPSMLLAGALGMNFNDFFWYKGRLGIFFAVQLGAVVSMLVLWLVFRKHDGKVPAATGGKLESVVPGFLLILLIVALVAASMLVPSWRWGAGAISLVAGGFAVLWWFSRHGAKDFFKQAWELDWGTGLFLVGVFILVGSLVETGLVEKFVGVLEQISGGSILLTYLIIVLGAVAGSAFVDNVPFVAAMLPVCVGLAARLSIAPELLAFGMVLGASVGGNITPIGASANIVAVGIARREGYHIGFRDFMKIGLPFTLAATAAACALIWFVWK